MTKLIKKRPFSVLFTLLCLVALGHLCSILPQDDTGDYGDSPLFGQSLRQSLARLSGVGVARADDDDKDSGPDNSTQAEGCDTQSGDGCDDPPPTQESTKCTTCDDSEQCCEEQCNSGGGTGGDDVVTEGVGQDCDQDGFCGAPGSSGGGGAVCCCPKEDGEDAGDGSSDNSCVDLKIQLGRSLTRSSMKAGYLRLLAMRPDKGMAQPQSLKLVSDFTSKIVGNIEEVPEIYKQNEEAIENDDIVYVQIRDQNIIGFHFDAGSYIGRPLFQQDTWRLYRVDEEGTYNATNAAFYDLHFIGKTCGLSKKYYRFNAITLDLAYIFDSMGRKIEAAAAGLDVIRSTYGEMKQIAAPQCLADIVVSNDACYQIRFYTRTQAGEKNADGFYYPSGLPYAVWTIENPDAETNGYGRLLVRKESGPETNRYFYTWIATNSEWVLTRPGTPYEESVTREWNEDRTLLTETRTVSVDSDICYIQQKEHTRYPWGTQITKTETDPDGIGLTKRWSFCNDKEQVGAYSRVVAIEYPDGMWRKFDYNTNGARTTVVGPWRNTQTNAAANDCLVTEYSYESHDPADTAAADDYRPRTELTRVNGIVVGKSFYVYKQVNGENVIIWEQCASQSAAYGDADNLRTISTYYSADTDMAARGKLKSRIKPNGSMVSYTYELGDYSGGTTNPGVFTLGEGEYLRESATYGCTNSPAGLACQTMRKVKILNAIDLVVLQGTEVYTGTSYERAGWTIYNYDDIGRLTNKWHSNGLYEEQSWLGFHKTASKDDEGIEKTYTYDEFGRQASQTRLGVAASGEYPAVPDLITTYNRDALGRVVGQTRSGGTLSQTSSSVYDMAGRIIRSVDVHGVTTTWAYAEGGRIVTKTLPGGATEVTTKYLDGRICSVTGTAAVARFYDYGAHADGSQWKVAYTGATNSPQWVRTVYDMLGHEIRIEKPAFGGGLVTNAFEYSNRGLLVETTSAGTVPMLYEYDAMGELVRRGQDVDQSGTLDLISNDRITDFDKSYILDDGGWYSQYVEKIYPESLNDLCVTQSLTRVAQSGSDCACQARQRMVQDLHGNQIETVVDVEPDIKRVTRTGTSSFSTNPAVQIAVDGLVFSSESKTGIKQQYRYDALGRRIQLIHPRTGTNVTHYSVNGRVEFTEDAAGYRMSYGYNPITGRPVAVTDALTNSVYTEYNKQGRVVGVWGATYPVLYDYDNAGRMVAMYTLRDDAVNTNTTYEALRDNITGFDKTTWQYDPASGLLTNKLYADGNGTAYSYTLGGRLKTRTWARGTTSDYSYDSLGNLTNINYSDDTPDISYTYNRLDQQRTITDVVGTRTNCYNSFGLLQAEKLSDGTTLNRLYDSLGRTAGISMGIDYLINYSYDSLGRFRSVTSSVCSMGFVADYSYLTNSSSLLTGYELSLATGPVLQVSRTYESRRDLITRIRNTFGTNLVSQFDYQNDAIGRRVRRIDSLVVTNDFAYNTRSEISEAGMGTNQYSYVYDPVGNRKAAGANAVSNLYTANELNQYVAISNSQSQQLMYDSDGNLTNDGVFAFSWNGENRLIKTESLGSVPDADKVRVGNIYDYMGRRIRKTVSSGYSSGSYTSSNVTTFIYDDWNMIAQAESKATDTNVTYFSHGLDLSGSRQGAGGVGGLLAVIEDGDGACFPVFDGNGNVTEYIDTNGTIVAEREYSPFGQTLGATGSKKDDFSHWFSTKYLDHEIDLYYYGYRFYDIRNGRWLTRDIIQEVGGLNLYSFTRNQPINSVDMLGDNIRTTVSGYPNIHVQICIDTYDECGEVSGEQCYGFGPAPNNLLQAIGTAFGFTVPGYAGTEVAIDDPEGLFSYEHEIETVEDVDEVVRDVVEQNLGSQDYNVLLHNCFDWVNDVLQQAADALEEAAQNPCCEEQD